MTFQQGKERKEKKIHSLKNGDDPMNQTGENEG